jgi:amino acid transporter
MNKKIFKEIPYYIGNIVLVFIILLAYGISYLENLINLTTYIEISFFCVIIMFICSILDKLDKILEELRKITEGEEGNE